MIIVVTGFYSIAIRSLTDDADSAETGTGKMGVFLLGRSNAGVVSSALELVIFLLWTGI